SGLRVHRPTGGPSFARFPSAGHREFAGVEQRPVNVGERLLFGGFIGAARRKVRFHFGRLASGRSPRERRQVQRLNSPIVVQKRRSKNGVEKGFLFRI